MDERNPNPYIHPQEWVREFERRISDLREDDSKDKKIALAEVFQFVSDSALFEREEEKSSSSPDVPPAVLPSSQDYIFVSYSHKDRKWLKSLEPFLAPSIDCEKFHRWPDTRIGAGTAWEKEIQRELACTKVVLLLVSQDFVASDCITKGTIPMLEAVEQKGLPIVWIAVSHCIYTETWFANYQPANDPMRPLDVLNVPRRNGVFVSVSQDIMRAMKR